MQDNMKENAISKPLPVVWNEVQRRMKLAGYLSKTIWGYASIKNHLAAFMENRRFDVYTPVVGELFLSEKAKIVTCSSLLNHLNLALTDAFWGTHFDTKNYSITNRQLKEMSKRLFEDSKRAGINEKSRNNYHRCLCILDIFMSENDLTEYSPKVGELFLQCIEKASNVGKELYTSVYRCNISRLDIYYRGDKPFFKRGKEHTFLNEKLQENLDILMNRLSDNKYKNTECVPGVIAQLDQYMSEQHIFCYTAVVGKRFLDFYQCHNSTQGGKNYAASVIAHFDDVHMGRPFRKIHKQKQYTIPDGFHPSFTIYYDECVAIGNSRSTLYKKTHILHSFISQLLNIGILDVSGINPNVVVEICTRIDRGHWSCIRGYLNCCALNNLTDRNYAFFVPHEKRPLLIPHYFTKEERLKLEEAPNRDTPIGKRDYAIILLADRLGLRSSDIANLSFTELQRGRRTIDFEQLKTKTSHNLPLLPEIEMAVMEYINNGRPESDSDKVFLSLRAPHDPITRRTIYYAVSKYFHLAGVDLSGRKHGAHALRASLGTDLVNNGFSYNETKHVLGHHDANSTRHYAVIDIHNLRPCAGKPHPAMGNFEKLLNGKEALHHE